MKELVAELARKDQECAALWSTLRQSVAAGEAAGKLIAQLSGSLQSARDQVAELNDQLERVLGQLAEAERRSNRAVRGEA